VSLFRIELHIKKSASIFILKSVSTHENEQVSAQNLVSSYMDVKFNTEKRQCNLKYLDVLICTLRNRRYS